MLLLIIVIVIKIAAIFIYSGGKIL